MKTHHGLALSLGLIVMGMSGCSCGSDRGPSGTPDASADANNFPFCLGGQFLCRDGKAVECDGMGGSRQTVDCEAEDKVCVNVLGCVECVPGTRSCADGVGQYCVSDGSGIANFDCDATQGMVCEPDGCKGVCAPPEITESYIGCDYYPTVTLNPVWSGFDFAVAIANASSAEANVTITRGDMQVQTLTLAANAIEVVTLDWVTQLKGGDQDECALVPAPGNTRFVADGAYRVRSDRPVTVYQFSPLTYEIAPAPEACPVAFDCAEIEGVTTQCLSYTNDASLLLPATSLTGNYTVMSWPSMGPTASFFAITATQDNTNVRVSGMGTFASGDGIDADGNGTRVMQRGDVLEVIAAHTNGGPPFVFGADASGSRVQADKPVQVISGHSCALVPTADTEACDHIEEAIFPSDSLGKHYLVGHPTTPGNTASPHVIRVAAIEEATLVTFDPPIHAPVTLDPNMPPLDLGLVTEDVEITGDKPILVAQYMVGQGAATNKTGDPSLSLAVPVEQFRDDYIFTASQTYASNFVSVIIRNGETVELDGTSLPLSEFTNIGNSGFSIARHALNNTGSESHHIRGDEPFGLVVYGYGSFTSYMVPGGLDLKRITRVPVLE